MTRVVKWWQRITFWNKLRGFIAFFAFGSEFAQWVLETDPDYRGLVTIASIFGMAITFIIEDKDNNGVADIFQKPKRPSRKP